MTKGLLLALALLCAVALPTRGEEAGVPPETLTVERVIALARTRAPEVRLAQNRVLEARGRLAGARALHTENPTLEAVAATSSRVDRRTQWVLAVPFELGLQRSYRVGTARAELRRDEYLAVEARRLTLGRVLAAYYLLVHAERRLELARERRTVAARLLQVATERHRSGDVARLDVRVAETELARAGSEVSSQEHNVARSRLDLALQLGLPSPNRVVVRGDLADHSAFADTAADGGARPDVQAASQELAAARSQLGLARSAYLPQLAFRLDYGHENGQSVTRPGVGVTVPLFNAGQGERGAARARVDRARIELERQQTTSQAEREGTSAAYAASLEAVRELEERGLPPAIETASLADESYRAGKIDLAVFLVVRRDVLDAQREFANRQLDAALAGIEHAVASGRLR